MDSTDAQVKSAEGNEAASGKPQTGNEVVHEADLTKGMEHMRAYVSVPSTHSPLPFKKHTNEASESVYGVPSAIIDPPRQPKQEEIKRDNPQKRTDPFQFGSRYLAEGDDIFEFNAWDHVEVDDQFKEFAEEQYQRQRESPVTDFDKQRFNGQPAKFWDQFYKNNTTNFFKNRKWLFQEFPALSEATSADAPPTTILEVGAGAGNTAFPILKENSNPGLRIHACDYAPKAVDLMRSSEEYKTQHMQADVWDAAGQSEDGGPALPPGLEPGSVDIVILIFIFSALQPVQWDQALRNIWNVLKPGGVVLFRDYGRGDLAQVRFKKGRWLEENFYVRGDGTRVYFFEKDELEQLFGGNVSPAADGSDTPSHRPRFEVLNLGVDRRMLVNRQRRLKMYRCWMQGRFQKPVS